VAGDLEQSERNLTAAIYLARKPNVTAILDLRQIMLLRGKSMAEVHAMYTSVLNRVPGLHGLRVVLASDRLQAGDSGGALGLLDEVARSEPPADAMAFAHAGEVLMQMNEHDRALEALRRGVSLYADNGLLHAQLGRALWFKNDRESALSHMRRATELEPKNPMYLHALGEMLALMGRAEEANKAEAAAQAIEAQATRRK
jgi:predicted Zn-dependent protease